MELTTVKQLFDDREAFLGKEVRVGGWIRSIRVSKAFAFGRAFNQAGNIYELNGSRNDLGRIIKLCQIIQPVVRYSNDSHIGIDGTERVVGRFCPCFSERVKKGTLSHVW